MPCWVNVRLQMPVRSRGTERCRARALVMSDAGVRYSYNPLTREIRVSGGQGDVRANVGSTEAWANGGRVRLEEPARSVEGTLSVPDRFLELATGMRASWDASSLRASPTVRFAYAWGRWHPRGHVSFTGRRCWVTRGKGGTRA
jgi:hypothetical protein